VIAAGTAIGLLVSVGGRPSTSGVLFSGPEGPERVPLESGVVLAPESSATAGGVVEGVRCDAREQVAFHIHTHLAVFVNGTLRPIPAGIGIVNPVVQQTANGPFEAATQCYYWLHVHAQDGVIHIESPTQHAFTLGEFFAIWRQPLDRTHVGSASGHLTVFVNGRIYRGDPANVVLGAHDDIQIDVGTPTVAPKRIDWAATGL
jgi:hypothetical protein